MLTRGQAIDFLLSFSFSSSIRKYRSQSLAIHHPVHLLNLLLLLVILANVAWRHEEHARGAFYYQQRVGGGG